MSLVYGSGGNPWQPHNIPRDPEQPPWLLWFAWYPVLVDQRNSGPRVIRKWVWLKNVARRFSTIWHHHGVGSQYFYAPAHYALTQGRTDE